MLIRRLSFIANTVTFHRGNRITQPYDASVILIHSTVLNHACANIHVFSGARRAVFATATTCVYDKHYSIVDVAGGGLVIGFVSERESLKTCRITHTHMLSILMSDRNDLSVEWWRQLLCVCTYSLSVLTKAFSEASIIARNVFTGYCSCMSDTDRTACHKWETGPSCIVLMFDQEFIGLPARVFVQNVDWYEITNAKWRNVNVI